MYPDEKHPSYGVFVKNFCNILDEMGVNYIKHIMFKHDTKIGKIVGYIMFYVSTVFALLLENYDLIYVHYASHSSIPVLIAHKLKKKPIYTNVHGSDVVAENMRQKKMQKYTKKILDISRKIIVPSEYFKILLSKRFAILQDKIYISPSGGINTKIFYKEKEKGNDRVIKLGYVGRISYKKGWDTLLYACANLQIPYILFVVGNGPEYIAMKNLSSKLLTDSNIKWLDLQPQEKLRNIYNEIDVLIFPTEREGESLGLVALEAMACGTPVIASDFAAAKYYIVNEENGFKFEKGSSIALKTCIENYYLLSEDRKRDMSKGAILTANQYKKENIHKSIEYILYS